MIVVHYLCFGMKWNMYIYNEENRGEGELYLILRFKVGIGKSTFALVAFNIQPSTPNKYLPRRFGLSPVLFRIRKVKKLTSFSFLEYHEHFILFKSKEQAVCPNTNIS